MIDFKTLNAEILSAHAIGDVSTLSKIYKSAGDAALALGNEDHGCFYLTHAYVYALEAGMDTAEEIHKTLKDYGRES